MKKALRLLGKIMMTLFVVLLLCVAGTANYIRSIRVDKPDFAPEFTDERLTYRLDTDSVRRIGNNYLKEISPGFWQMYVEGSPFHRGEVMGALTADLHAFQEDAFIRQVHKMVPNDSYLRLLKYFVTFFNRHIQQYIPRENLEEIYGESLYMSSEYDNIIGSPYMRILNYHAAHDIGHALQDRNFVAGCTSFAAWSNHSEDGKVIVGRNFDFYVGDEFAKNKIVAFLKPDRGIPFAMITWPGMTGVVSGMNMEQITVTINAAKSDYPTEAKTPVSLVARNILQYSRTIDEAIAIARRFEMFVSESFLVSSGKEGRAVIIEKSPEKMAVFTPDSSLLFCSNHFQSPIFHDDVNNADFKKNSSSGYRMQRLQQLTSGLRINPFDAAAILRNPYGINGSHIGWGNEDALNQFIAHHGVIFKPAEYRMWVSTAPYQTGRMICFDLKDIFDGQKAGLHPTEDIAADSALIKDAIVPYQRFKAIVTSIKEKTGEVAYAEMEKAIRLNPDYYYGYEVAGDCYFRGGKKDEAADMYAKALQRDIPNRKDRERIAGQLEACKQ
ncbi:MAG TPA: C45 family autoproteolytic acyltransferase/hydrolase [Saprospiraceae bacterium]|nr:C45 family autoproteolytic acyltransferase/hydrolase [Saprospiraceae bacterium]